MSALSAVLSTRVQRRRKFGEVSCTECTDQGNDFEMTLIPTVKKETRHSVDGSFGTVVNFGRSIIIAELWRPEVAIRLKKSFFCVFWKNDPLRETFQNSVPKKIHRDTEIGKVVRYLPDKNAWLSRSRCCANCAQNMPGPAPDNVLRVLWISSKSAHFRQSYIRTREHRQSALESESNIRLKPSFDPNENYNIAIHVMPVHKGEIATCETYNTH